MEICKGIAVSPGIAMAEALVLDAGEVRIPTRYVDADQVRHELELLRRAVASSVADLAAQRHRLAAGYGEDTAAIFDFHIGVLGDPKLQRELEDLISSRNCSAAYAVSRAFLTLQRRFSTLTDPMFAQRVRDIQDIEKRL